MSFCCANVSFTGEPQQPGTPLTKPVDGRCVFDAQPAAATKVRNDSHTWRCRLQAFNTAPKTTTKGCDERRLKFPDHTFLHTAKPADRIRAAAGLLAEARRYQRARGNGVDAASAHPPIPTLESIQHITSSAVRARLLHPHPVPRFPVHQDRIARLLLGDIQLLMVPCTEASPDGNYAHVMGELGRLRLW